MNDVADKTHEKLDVMNGALADQNNLLKQMLQYHKQTADGTDALNDSINNLQGPTINNISSNSSIINTQGSTDGNAAMRRKLFTPVMGGY
jgi:hypothetical protein